jgi:hypothetical protein
MAIAQCAQKIPIGQYQTSGIHKLTAGGPLTKSSHNLAKCSDQEKVPYARHRALTESLTTQLFKRSITGV